MDKVSSEKHKKYDDFYSELNRSPVKDTEYWGLGIENESYLMFHELVRLPRYVYLMNQKPDRYSVNYWNNYLQAPLFSALKDLPNTIETPIYINGYLFQNSDISGNHKTLQKSYPNPNFSGKTIDTFLKEESPLIDDLFKKNVIYDGDTIEFTTYNFYKTNVISAIEELVDVKRKFLKEVNAHLQGKGIFQDEMIYPLFNYGFATHLSNPENIAMCNNGTYHLNITLPTQLDSNGNIADLKSFRESHANAIRGIQWIEPLLVALYGSPDILNTINAQYSGGSQRLSLSRYIGVGTYDTRTMEKGKLLDTHNSRKHTGYFNELHRDSPYIPPQKNGYDFNYNKFTKHGIELRILDSFPEEYLEAVMNFLVLICDYSTKHFIPDPTEQPEWNKVVIECLREGSNAMIGPEFFSKLYDVFGIDSCWLWLSLMFSKNVNKSPMALMNDVSAHLYAYNRRGDVSMKLSPNMRPIKFVDYNSYIKSEFKKITIQPQVQPQVQPQTPQQV